MYICGSYGSRVALQPYSNHKGDAMKRRMTVSGGVFGTLCVLAIAGSAFAGQDRASAGAPAGGGGGSAASGASAGSSGSSGSGSSTSSAGGSTSGGDRGGSRGDHGRAGATGGMGVAMPRGGGEHHTGGGGATPRTAGGGGGGSRVESGERTNATPGRAREGSERGVPEHARPRDGQPTTGTAVPRPAGSVPPTTGGGYTIVPGGYYGGGYYGLYPWMIGGIGYYGGYYDPFYDPWYGGYPSYPQTTSAAGYDEGSLRLKIKPKNAEVYVDGYYVGIVDEFDGIFQRLHIDAGSHRVEVRANGYEPLVFDVRITPDHTTTYQGEMKRIQ